MEVDEIWLLIDGERGERERTQEGEKWGDFCSCFFPFCGVFSFNGDKRYEKKRE